MSRPSNPVLRAGKRLRSPRLLAVVATMGVLSGAVPGSAPLLSPTPAAAAPADNFTLAKTDDVGGEALIGENITFTLTATGTQTSNAALYNLSFRDVLPVGVDYVSASPSPTAVLADVPNPGETTVIWENVADLPADSQAHVSLTVDTNPDFTGGNSGSSTVPVGSTILNSAEAVASLDAFTVPDWSPATGDFTGDFDGNATATDSVDVVPFRVTKTGPGELLRGVHANGFDSASGTTGGLYTVQIENNPDYPIDAVTLQDVLDPGLEFLGCDNYYVADNTTLGEEWVGSGPVATGSNCAPTALGTPTSVDTGAGGETIVDWTIGNLTPGQIVTVQYQAGIPLFENRPFATSPPSAAGLNQGRNLDNNTGPSTGEPDRTTIPDPELLTAPEQQLDNVATASGTYVPTGATGTDSDTHTTESEDLVIVKSSAGSLSQGTIVNTTLTVTTSEYRDFSDLVVRDLMPSALCFLGTYNGCDRGVVGLGLERLPGPGHRGVHDQRGPGRRGPGPRASRRRPVWHRPVRTGVGLCRRRQRRAEQSRRRRHADHHLRQRRTQPLPRAYASLPGEPVLAGDTVTNVAEVSGPDTVADASLAADPVDPDGGIDGDTTSAGLANALPSLDKRVSVKTGPLANGASVTSATCATDYNTITWSDGNPAEPATAPATSSASNWGHRSRRTSTTRVSPSPTCCLRDTPTSTVRPLVSRRSTRWPRRPSRRARPRRSCSTSAEATWTPAATVPLDHRRRADRQHRRSGLRHQRQPAEDGPQRQRGPRLPAA
ncbi:MAG: hypothetical protein R2710_24650 [Acidimicrobiales bacterium]